VFGSLETFLFPSVTLFEGERVIPQGVALSLLAGETFPVVALSRLAYIPVRELSQRAEAPWTSTKAHSVIVGV